MAFNYRTLIFSPHQDDEILGCGGLIAYLMDRGMSDRLCIHYFNGSEHPATDIVDNEEYKNENAKLIQKIGCRASWSPHHKINLLETVPQTKHITEIENLINAIQPDNLFIPFPDYNADHRRVYNATITATRIHDKNWYVKNIFIYEQICTVQSSRVYTQFMPSVFLPIDIDKKLDLWDYYKTQHRDMRTPRMMKSLAETRGLQCNAKHAEAFQPVRLTIK